MRKHNFVTILYSVLTKKKVWKISKQDSFEEYRDSLFHPERLQRREEIFEKITLPSLSAFCENTTVLVFTSSEFPADFKDRLNKLVKPYDNIKIIDVDIDDNVFSKVGATVRAELEGMGEDVLYSTIRLDDDDALSKNFMISLEKYLESKFVGFCISFSSGLGLMLDEGRVISAHKKKSPKIALGLVWINKFNFREKSFERKPISVYGLGNHVSVEERVPTLIDPREISWARSIHDTSDIYSSSLVNAYQSQPEVDLSVLDKHFGIKV